MRGGHRRRSTPSSPTSRYRDSDVAAPIWVRAVADKGILTAWSGTPASLERAQEALAAARELGDRH